MMLNHPKRIGLVFLLTFLVAGCIQPELQEPSPTSFSQLDGDPDGFGPPVLETVILEDVDAMMLIPIGTSGLTDLNASRDHWFDLVEYHAPVTEMALNLLQPPALENLTSELWPDDPEAVNPWAVQTSWITDTWQTLTLHVAGTSHRSTITNEALSDRYARVEGQRGWTDLPLYENEVRLSVATDCMWAVFASATPQHVNLSVERPATLGEPILVEDAVERFSFEGGGFTHDTTVVVNPEPPGTLGVTTGASVTWHMDEGDIVRFVANHDNPGTLHLLDPNGKEIPSEERWQSWSGTGLVAKGNAVPSAQVIAGVAGEWSFVVDEQAGQDLSVEIMVVHSGAYTHTCPDTT